MMVRDFQSVIGTETKQQCLEQIGRLPDVVVACVGGGSNSAGMFYPFVGDVGSNWSASRPAAAATTRRATTPPRSATASPACCTAPSATSCRTSDGQTADVHSVSAGLDYPGVGPEHSYWKDTRPRALHQRRRRRRPQGFHLAIRRSWWTTLSPSATYTVRTNVVVAGSAVFSTPAPGDACRWNWSRSPSATAGVRSSPGHSPVPGARCTRAGRAGCRHRGTNPLVGCVLVRNGAVIGEGWHERPRMQHAEIVALAAARDASGATAYVSLEPCAHHGRTPPCSRGSDRSRESPAW